MDIIVKMTMRNYITLMENMLLLENRLDFLSKKFIPIFNTEIKNHSLNISSIISHLSEGKTIGEQLFNYIVSLDPNKTKENTQWLINCILRKNNPMPLEDLINAPEILTNYMLKKRKHQLNQDQTNINKFKSLSELQAILNTNNKQIETFNNSEKEKAFKESKIIYNSPNYAILIPKTEYAACFFGRGTSWCTAWGDPKGMFPDRTNQFISYNNKGSLYIIFDKHTKEKWQFHFETHQYMDKNDHQLNINKFLEQHKEIEEFFNKDVQEPYTIIDNENKKLYVYVETGKISFKSSKANKFSKNLGCIYISDDNKILDYENIRNWLSDDDINDIIKLFNNLHLTANDGFSLDDKLYYKNNKWGSFYDLSESVYKENDYDFRNININESNPKKVLVKNQKIEIGYLLYDHRGILNFYLNFPININDKLQTAIANFILNTYDGTDNTLIWDNDSAINPDNISTYASKLFLDHSLYERLGNPFKLYNGNDNVFKKYFLNWAFAYGFITNKEINNNFIDNYFIIERFNNLKDFIDEYGNKESNFIINTIEGKTHFDSYLEDISDEDIYNLLNQYYENNEEDLLKLGNWLKKNYNDDLDDDFDPSDLESIIIAIKNINPTEITSIIYQATSDGIETGAESKAITVLESAINDDDNLYFIDHNNLTKTFNYETPCCLCISINELVDNMNKDIINIIPEIEYSGFVKAISDDYQFVVEEPYDGYDGFDDKAAIETFDTLINDLIS